MEDTDVLVEIEGTPDEVKAAIGVASKVEPRICGKKVVHPGLVQFWVRANVPPNDLAEAIRKKAGIGRTRAVKAEDSE